MKKMSHDIAIKIEIWWNVTYPRIFDEPADFHNFFFLIIPLAICLKVYVFKSLSCDHLTETRFGQPN